MRRFQNDVPRNSHRVSEWATESQITAQYLPKKQNHAMIEKNIAQTAYIIIGAYSIRVNQLSHD